MGDLDKRLIVTLAQLDFLLPEGVFSDNEGADAFSHEPVNDGSGGNMQGEGDTAVVPLSAGLLLARGGGGPFSDLRFPFLLPLLSSPPPLLSTQHLRHS